MSAPMMRRRAARRSCWLHGDNGCEIQREAGPVTRALERRRWRRAEQADLPPTTRSAAPAPEDGP